MRRRYSQAMTRVGQTSTNGVLFQVPILVFADGMLSAMLA